MALSEHLAALTPVAKGMPLSQAITASRLNAIMGAIRALANGENVSGGPGVLVSKNGMAGLTLKSTAKKASATTAGAIRTIEFVPPTGVITPDDIAAALVEYYEGEGAPAPSAADWIQLYSDDDNGGDGLKVLRARIRLSATEPIASPFVVPFTLFEGEDYQATWYALTDLMRLPQVQSIVATVADENAAITADEIETAIVDFYNDDKPPQEFDVFVIHRADNGKPEVRVTLTQEPQESDRWQSDVPTEIHGREWYFMVQDTSGRVRYEDDNVLVIVGNAGIEMFNKTGDDGEGGWPSMRIVWGALGKSMEIREVAVVDGSEVKLANIVSSEPASQDPAVFLQRFSAGTNIIFGTPVDGVIPLNAGVPEGGSYSPGGGIAFGESVEGVTPISVYLNDIAPESIQDNGTLLKLEYVEVGGGLFNLKYSSRLADDPDSDVRLVDNGDGTFSYNLSDTFRDAYDVLLETVANILARMDGVELTCEDGTVGLTWGTLE